MYLRRKETDKKQYKCTYIKTNRSTFKLSNIYKTAYDSFNSKYTCTYLTPIKYQLFTVYIFTQINSV